MENAGCFDAPNASRGHEFFWQILAGRLRNLAMP